MSCMLIEEHLKNYCWQAVHMHFDATAGYILIIHTHAKKKNAVAVNTIYQTKSELRLMTGKGLNGKVVSRLPRILPGYFKI